MVCGTNWATSTQKKRTTDIATLVEPKRAKSAVSPNSCRVKAPSTMAATPAAVFLAPAWASDTTVRASMSPRRT